LPKLAASAALRLQQLHPEPDRPIDLSAWRRRSPSAFSYVAGPCDDSTPSRARPLICRWWSAGTVAPSTGGHHSNRRPSNSGRAIDGRNHHSRGRWLISSSSTPLWNRTRRQPRQSTRTGAGEAEVARPARPPAHPPARTKWPDLSEPVSPVSVSLWPRAVTRLAANDIGLDALTIGVIWRKELRCIISDRGIALRWP